MNRHVTIKRRVVVPVYRGMARGVRFYPPPRVCAISLPKAGTHLLSSLLGHLPRMMFSGLHLALDPYSGPVGVEPDRGFDYQPMRGQMASVRDGQFMTAHFPAVPEVTRTLDELGFRTLVIVRDPRDVVVSAAHYIAADRAHQFHPRLAHLAFPDQLMSMITGFPADSTSPGLPPIGVRLERYQGWLMAPRVCVVRFEELVGPGGDGSFEAQLAATNRVADWVGRSLDGRQARRIAAKVWSPKSSTFRSGRSGGWQATFSDRHRQAFDREAGSALEAFGYAG